MKLNYLINIQWKALCYILCWLITLSIFIIHFHISYLLWLTFFRGSKLLQCLWNKSTSLYMNNMFKCLIKRCFWHVESCQFQSNTVRKLLFFHFFPQMILIPVCFEAALFDFPFLSPSISDPGDPNHRATLTFISGLCPPDWCNSNIYSSCNSDLVSTTSKGKK